MKLVICDLDGVCNSSSAVRSHLVPSYTDKSSYWAEWHKAHTKERINGDMKYMLYHYKELGFQIAYLSNRQEACFESTAAQLQTFPRGRLWLRGALDDTPPPEYKANAVKALIVYAEVTELVVIDDCAKNIEAIRAACSGDVKVFVGLHVNKFE